MPALAFAAMAALASVGCSLSTEASGPVADVEGAWAYEGTMTPTARDLQGTLLIDRQVEDVIEGTLSWTENDGLGGIVARGGAVAGAVIGFTDIDFDVSIGDEARRHVARISANRDTLVGVWTEVGGGESGTFRAVRQAVAP